MHLGHLRLALETQQRLGLTHGVQLVPAAVPALRDAPNAGADVRLELLKAAVAGNDDLSVDEREIQRGGTSFTVDTLESFRQEFPRASISFIVGMDAFARLHQWHRWRAIPELAHIAVARRPGAASPDESVLTTLLKQHQVEDPAALKHKPSGSICVLDIPLLDVSATYVRQLVAGRRSIRYLVPDAVADIIERRGVYCDGK